MASIVVLSVGLLWSSATRTEAVQELGAVPLIPRRTLTWEYSIARVGRTISSLTAPRLEGHWRWIGRTTGDFSAKGKCPSRPDGDTCLDELRLQFRRHHGPECRGGAAVYGVPVCLLPLASA